MEKVLPSSGLVGLKSTGFLNEAYKLSSKTKKEFPGVTNGVKLAKLSVLRGANPTVMVLVGLINQRQFTDNPYAYYHAAMELIQLAKHIFRYRMYMIYTPTLNIEQWKLEPYHVRYKNKEIDLIAFVNQYYDRPQCKFLADMLQGLQRSILSMIQVTTFAKHKKPRRRSAKKSPSKVAKAYIARTWKNPYKKK